MARRRRSITRASAGSTSSMCSGRSQRRMLLPPPRPSPKGEGKHSPSLKGEGKHSPSPKGEGKHSPSLKGEGKHSPSPLGEGRGGGHLLISQRITSPATIDTRPKKRSWPSVSSSALRKVSRHRRGATNGRIPSNTNISAIPAAMSSPMKLLAAARALEVLEEVGARIQHHHVALRAHALAVRLHAAVEAVELGIAAERLRVDARGLRVALALDALGVAVGLGDGDLARAVGLGLDLLALRLSRRAQLVGDALPLGFHAPVDVRRDLGDGVDALP